ncbi:hypothetical protein FBU30_010860 [Linnemannia zychae]|nr:hypothetical protein FBU30_010860 [Linnemannia zychae]
MVDESPRVDDKLKVNLHDRNNNLTSANREDQTSSYQLPTPNYPPSTVVETSAKELVTDTTSAPPIQRSNRSKQEMSRRPHNDPQYVAPVAASSIDYARIQRDLPQMEPPKRNPQGPSQFQDMEEIQNREPPTNPNKDVAQVHAWYEQTLDRMRKEHQKELAKVREDMENRRAEQEWFLTTQVTPSLDAIQKALEACQDAARLQDDVMGALTLAISSPNNDILKGFVTLSSSFIVKGELTVKLPKLPIVKAAIHSQIPASMSAAQSLLSAPNATLATIETPSSSAYPITGGIVGKGGTGTGEINHGENQIVAMPEETEATKTDNGQGSQQSSSTDFGLTATTNTAVGVGSGLLIAANSVPTPAGMASTMALITAGSSSAAAPGPAVSALPTPPMNTHQLLHSYRPPGHITQPYALEQIRDVQNHIAQAIFRLEDYRKWRNESINVGEGATLDIREITRALKTMLELLERHLRSGIEAMAQPGKEKLYPFRVCDPKIFSPALSEDFVIEFYICDSQLVCAAYALHLSSGASTQISTGNALANYLQQALPGATSNTSASTLSQQPSSAAIGGGASSGSSSDYHPSLSNALAHHGQSSGSASGSGGIKSGHGTPRPSSPLHHHNPISGHPIHQSHNAQYGSGNGGGNGSGGRPTKPWSPSRSPSTPQIPHYPEPVVLPSSSKIGQTSKGGIK